MIRRNFCFLGSKFRITVATLISWSVVITSALADIKKISSGTGNDATISIKIVEGPSNKSKNNVTVQGKSGNKITQIKITIPKGFKVPGVNPNPDGTTTITKPVTSGAIGTNIPVSFDTETTDGLTKNGNDSGKTAKVEVDYGSDSPAAGDVVIQNPKSPKDAQKKNSLQLSTGGVSFDSTTGKLTISNDVITDTGFPFDTVLGAQVVAPSYTLVGPSPDNSQMIFAATDEDTLALLQGQDTLLSAAAPFLIYSDATNEFFSSLDLLGLAGSDPASPFFNPTLASSHSPSLDLLASMLNPSGAGFLPDIPFGFYLSPDANFFDATGGYTKSSASPVTNLFGVIVPEPSARILLSTVLLGIGIARARVGIKAKRSVRCTSRVAARRAF